MFFIKIYIKESYINYYDTSIQMCGQYCILAPGPDTGKSEDYEDYYDTEVMLNVTSAC